MNFYKKTKQLLIICLVAFVVAIIPLTAQAQSILPACVSSGDCTICDILNTAIQIGVFILGIVGGLVLLMFVYGGFMFLTSGGASDKIKKGKDILVNAVVGLAITFLAYTIVLAFVGAVSGKPFQWDTTKLTCAQITYPTITGSLQQGAGDSKEGKDCSLSSFCGTGLFCDVGTPAPATAPTSGKCAKVLQPGTVCYGRTIEAAGSLAGDFKKYADIIAVAAVSIPGVGQAAAIPSILLNVGIFTKSNAACINGNCRFVALSGILSGNSGVGTCADVAAGTGTIPIGGKCASSNACKTSFCNKADSKCTAYKNFGDPCDGLALDEDDRVCGSVNEVGNCDDKLPGASDCNSITSALSWSPAAVYNYPCSNKCVPGTDVGAKNTFCTLSAQCGMNLFCASSNFPLTPSPTNPTTEGNNPTQGYCKPRGAIGTICGDWEVNSTWDNNVCLTKDCSASIGINKCETP